MSNYSKVFDMEPSEKTAEIIRYGNHKAAVQYTVQEQYSISFERGSYYVDVASIHGWGVFRTREAAQAHIGRRCTIRQGRKKIFKLCKCGPLPWDYYHFDNNVVAEICNTCGNPLYQVCLDVLNQQAIADIDLFDLLG